VRINNRGNSARALDVSNVSVADNAPIQLWTYGGTNQQWQPVAEGGGYYHLVNRHSGKCLDVPAALHRRQLPAGAVHLQRHGRAVVPAGAATMTAGRADDRIGCPPRTP
jgi:hypothetical protein